VRPNEKPELPARWKGKGRAECLDIFNEDGEWVAEEVYGGRAIMISGPGMTVWATMRDEEVGEVKVYLRVCIIEGDEADGIERSRSYFPRMARWSKPSPFIPTSYAS
jgi:hypothetical protein